MLRPGHAVTQSVNQDRAQGSSRARTHELAVCLFSAATESDIGAVACISNKENAGAVTSTWRYIVAQAATRGLLIGAEVNDSKCTPRAQELTSRPFFARFSFIQNWGGNGRAHLGCALDGALMAHVGRVLGREEKHHITHVHRSSGVRPR